eukprot:TRINITY_DN547_c0_g1_i1.p1 TRINITY_DN547_c0_g1~~TRINITY_DN547_c0_g1_i1.p1  ORF type:complete len:150 (+),score=18.94 TRINITY_DN547_c0_g1_i1:126-575(+)
MEGDSTQKPNTPPPCSNGCGFFGNPLTSNMCSKCYRDTQAKQKSPAVPDLKAPDLPSVPSTPAPTEVSTTTTASSSDEPGKKIQTDTTRCWNCNKKVGLLGFKCRCDYVFCSMHRHSDKHCCPFDYKGLQKQNLEKLNPVIKGSKLDKI